MLLHHAMSTTAVQHTVHTVNFTVRISFCFFETQKLREPKAHITLQHGNSGNL